MQEHYNFKDVSHLNETMERCVSIIHEIKLFDRLPNYSFGPDVTGPSFVVTNRNNSISSSPYPFEEQQLIFSGLIFLLHAMLMRKKKSNEAARLLDIYHIKEKYHIVTDFILSEGLTKKQYEDKYLQSFFFSPRDFPTFSSPLL